MAASQVLARKWRPRSFTELVGQDHVVRALGNALQSGRLHHAYLFTGTRGVGKTTIARILAKCLNCETGITATPCGKCSACMEIDSGCYPDMLEVDAATNTKVEEMRELLDNAQYMPVAGRFKVYIIDEVHMLSRSAFNSMLKTLEEPPEHVKFILATTDPQKVPVTVLSRCLQFNLKQMPPEVIGERLSYVLKEEGIAFEPGALPLIARAAQGSMRDSLSLLDQAIAFGAGKVTQAEVGDMLGSIEQEHLFDILQALSQQDAAALIQVAQTMNDRNLSFEQALQELAALLHEVTLARALPDQREALGISAAVLPFTKHWDAETLQLLYQIAIQSRRDLSLAPDEVSGFRMALLRMLAFQPSTAGAPATSAVLPASAAPTPRAAPAAPGGPVPDSLGDWSALVRQLTGMGMAYELARNSQLERYEGGTLHLILDQAQKQLAPYKDRLRTALATMLNADIRVMVEVGAADLNTVARIENVAADVRQQGATQAILEDPFVKAMVESLGGKLVESSIKPKLMPKGDA
jgi:DNA polymerase-3 subunit gamma/tau